MASSTEARPFSVLFVCLGNICRSPAAEGVFTDIVKKRGLDSKFKIDSAGTINYHEGNPADPRMRAASKRQDIMEAFNRWKFRETLPDDAHKKVKLMCSFCKKHDETEVPDPYYGGPQGFEKKLPLHQTTDVFVDPSMHVGLQIKVLSSGICYRIALLIPFLLASFTL
ncbi:unnamed protein product [Dovyalis caffra]|uniref:acid phosphatase n=1 Tax=Dovyalis caffra TaxID=77055 RepID=A0AAV1R5N7_9ROSI|nr:unnamed protein product [Dovyalis caffra]